jgi:hypothetical protein
VLNDRGDSSSTVWREEREEREESEDREEREKREKRGYGRVEAVRNNTMTVVSAANGGYAYK